MRQSLLFILFLICFKGAVFSQCNALFGYDFITKNKVMFRPQYDSLKYAWDFGDGIQTDFKSPLHFFNKSGIYKVCLSVSNRAKTCSDSYCMDIKVDIDSCDTLIDFQYSELSPQTIQFSISNLPSKVQYEFDLNSERFKVDSNFQYTFLSIPPYEVCLSTFDSTTGCSYKLCKSINVQSTKKTGNVFSRTKSYIYKDDIRNQYRIVLEKDVNEVLNVRLINTLGMEIQSKSAVNSSEMFFDSVDLSTGIYLYIVDYKGFVIASGKFLH